MTPDSERMRSLTRRNLSRYFSQSARGQTEIEWPVGIGEIVPNVYDGTLWRDFMKRVLFVVLLFVTVLAALPAAPQNAFTADQVKYGPVPPVLAPGAQLAVLEGDP